jgi:hypothetical protein
VRELLGATQEERLLAWRFEDGAMTDLDALKRQIKRLVTMGERSCRAPMNRWGELIEDDDQR